MADRYWVGSSGNWDATSTANWAATSGGASGASAPTSADNVIFDANSNTLLLPFTVTITGTSASPAACLDFSTSSLDGVMTLTMGATAELDCYGSLTLPATNFTWSGTTGALLVFQSTSTGKTFTTNGITISNTNVSFSGSGGGWTLGSALTMSSSATFRFNAGTISTGNFNITTGAMLSSSVTTTTFNLGSSTITLAGSSAFTFTGSNLTFNAGTSQITCSNASPTFAGGGLTFYNVSFTSVAAGTTTITGANTFNNLTQTSRSATGLRIVSLGANQTVSGTLTLGAANQNIRRIQVVSDTIGTQRTITLNGTLATLADCDFRDIGTAGSVGTWTGTRLGNGLGNSGITFTTAKDVYWNLAAGGNWTGIAWALSSGGATSLDNFPLAQDKIIIEDTGLNSGATVTFINGTWWVGELNISTRTLPMTFANGTVVVNIYKNVTLSSVVTMTGTALWNFFGQSTTQILDVNTATFVPPITIESPSGTLQLAENTTCSATVTLTSGTLDLNNNVLTALTFSSSNSNTRAITFGTGNITITGNGATVWTTATATNFSYTGTPTVNCTYSGSTGNRTLTPGVTTTGGTESNALNFNVSAGSDTIVITGNSTFKNLSFTGFSGILNNTGRTIFGNLTYSAAMTTQFGNGNTIFSATSGTQLLTSNGITINNGFSMQGTATVQLQDNLTTESTRQFTLTSGTLDLSSGNRTLSCGLFSSTNSNTRAILFGTGNITVTGNDATIFNMTTMTNYSYTGTPTVNATYSGSTGTRTITTATVAGGATEANVPSFNVSAGSDIVTVASNVKNLNFTGFTGTFTNSVRNVSGNLTIASGMTLSAGSLTTSFIATSGTQQFTTNGKTLDFPITQDGVGGTVQLQDALTMGSTQALTLTNGTFNANNQNVTVGDFASSNANTRTLTMGSGTWTIQDSGSAWNLATTTGLTLNRGTSTISMTSTSAKTFAGGGLTYYKLNQGGTGTLTLTGANTFFDMTNTVQPCTITFPASTTTSFSNFNVDGTAGNLVSLRSSTTGTRYTLAKVA
jgi:hypothetical protein